MPKQTDTVAVMERVLGMVDQPESRLERPERRPILVIASGRGRTGKSTLLSYLAATCRQRHPLRVIDADPKNSALAGRHEDAETSSGEGEDRRVWIEVHGFDRIVSDAGTAEQHDVLLDLGGGDLLLKRWGYEVGLAQMLVEAGVDPVLIHLIGPSEQDLAHVAELEDKGVFAPERTILAMNAGLVPSTSSVAEAFAKAGQSKVVESIIKRGGRSVLMPRLDCLAAMEDAGVSFAQALSSEPSRLKFIDRTRANRWLRDQMPAMLDPVSDWLPERKDLRGAGS